MRLLHPIPDSRRRGAALLLSFLVLMVIIAIVYQLNRTTVTDQQVADKNLQMTKMDQAIQSAMLEVLQQLQEDGEMRSGSGEGGARPAVIWVMRQEGMASGTRMAPAVRGGLRPRTPMRWIPRWMTGRRWPRPRSTRWICAF